MGELTRYLPPDGVKLALTLALSLLLGIEREQHKADHYLFGGIRTYPLIGIIGYAFALLSGDQILPVAIGFLAVTGLMLLSYRHKLTTDETAGMTTEISALGTYLVGALICRDYVWIAATVVVLSVLLLELKVGLEGLTKRIPRQEVTTFATFLLLTVVILPMVPNRDFGRFALNPFKTWLAVIAVSGISYGSYVLQKLAKGKGGVLLSAVLGGAYSSTITTVALAKRASSEHRPRLFSGAILMASGLMYLRLIALLAIFNRALLVRLGIPFGALGLLALTAGFLWSRLPEHGAATDHAPEAGRNPLELRAALLFALVFIASLVATQWAAAHLGRGGVIALGGVLGVTDVDPFILGVAQTAGVSTPLAVGAQGVVVAAASNNLAKAAYAFIFADRATGRWALLFLALLALLGLSPLLWLV